MQQTALVTGGAGGIGEAICLKLASAGYFVYIGYSSSEAKASALAEEISGKAVKLDVTSSAEISTFSSTMPEFLKSTSSRPYLRKRAAAYSRSTSRGLWNAPAHSSRA